jgi:hypothetical protein
VFAVAVLLTACASKGTDCSESVVGSLTLREVAPTVGYSAQDVINRFAGAYTEHCRWLLQEETDSALQFTVAYEEGPISLVSDGCVEDFLEIDVAVELSTDDGRLKEDWMTALRTFGRDGDLRKATIKTSVTPSEITGALVVREEAESVTTTISLRDGQTGGDVVTETCPVQNRETRSEGDEGVLCAALQIAQFGTWIDAPDE